LDLQVDSRVLSTIFGQICLIKWGVFWVLGYLKRVVELSPFRAPWGTLFLRFPFGLRLTAQKDGLPGRSARAETPFSLIKLFSVEVALGLKSLRPVLEPQFNLRSPL
jgi:hypothetical protein